MDKQEDIVNKNEEQANSMSLPPIFPSHQERLDGNDEFTFDTRINNIN